MNIAFFENKEDASEFIICSSEIEEEKPSLPDFGDPQYEIVPHRFNSLEEYQFTDQQYAQYQSALASLGRKKSEKTA